MLFVPHSKERSVLARLRAKICGQVKSNYAKRSPVHMSVISGMFSTKNYAAFEKDLKEFCKDQKSITLQLWKKTSVLPDISWSGIHVKNTPQLKQLRTNLHSIRNKHATLKQEHFYKPPHITLAHKAVVDQLKPEPSPFETLLFDRITVVRRTSKYGNYKIHKHYKFSKK